VNQWKCAVCLYQQWHGGQPNTAAADAQTQVSGVLVCGQHVAELLRQVTPVLTKSRDRAPVQVPARNDRAGYQDGS
jgi:hypothetical protein